MRWILPPLVLFASLGLLASTMTSAQQPELRSLSRDSDASGPVTVDREAVAPLFTSGTPSQAVDWVSSGQTETCRDEMIGWVEANPDHEHIAEARFLLGYCAHESGDHDRALRLLSETTTSLPLLSGVSAYLAAKSAYRLESYQTVIALTLSVPNDSLYEPRSQFLRARALYRSGRVLESVGVLRDFVQRYPNAYYIADVELELAQALSEVGELEEAANLFFRVSVRYPGSDGEATAAEALEGLIPSLPEEARSRFAEMDGDDLIARATVLFDRHRSEAVIDLLEDELDDLEVGTPVGCQAAYLVAKSYSKLRRHSDAIPFYRSIADASCDEDLVVKALYNIGRALWNIDRDADGAAVFRQLYTDHSDHTYADDAMLYEARIERSNDNETQFLQILEEQVRRFPEGDMLGDANWLLFEHEMSSRNYEAAIAFADAVSPRTGENTLYNRGRIAYFRARALELSGQNAEALVAYEDVAGQVPLSFYALLALNRLTALDSTRGEAVIARLRAGTGSEVVTGVPVEPAQIVEDPLYRRGLLLLRLGLLDLAQQQFDRLADAYPNQDGPLWLVTFLFDAAGAYHISHNIPRRQIESFLAAYPTDETIEHWRLAYPAPFGDEIAEAAEERDLDPYLIYAIMREESGFNPRAESWANARGLMQLMVPTAESMASRIGMRHLRQRDLFRPETSIALGSEYLSVLANRYDGHPALTIAGYNGGEGNVDRWLRENGSLPIDRFVEEIPYRQTRDYTKRVVMTYWIYRWLYSDRPLLEVPFQVPGAR